MTGPSAFRRTRFDEVPQGIPRPRPGAACAVPNLCGSPATCEWPPTVSKPVTDWPPRRWRH